MGRDRSGVTGRETALGGARSSHREAAQGVIEFRLTARAPALEPEVAGDGHDDQSERPPVIHQCVDERATLLQLPSRLRAVRRLRSLGDGWRRRRRRLTGLRGGLFGRRRSSGSGGSACATGGSSTGGGGGAVWVCAAAGGGAGGAAAAPLELAADLACRSASSELLMSSRRLDSLSWPSRS